MDVGYAIKRLKASGVLGISHGVHLVIKRLPYVYEYLTLKANENAASNNEKSVLLIEIDSPARAG